MSLLINHCIIKLVLPFQEQATNDEGEDGEDGEDGDGQKRPKGDRVVKRKPEDLITMDEGHGWPLLPQRESGKLEQTRNIMRAYVTLVYREFTS
jgi:hypothetical protein